ncbi:MAG TPA: aldo/keto reductase [Patescibacteria group bacterium]|jgi:aryl-alcohol dehydrogenase-like predicted oxidoreductase|nr:aldo/keto reductase [Patescibacteria group bacterium]
MKTRKFGDEQIPVSEIGLGTWQIGGSWGDVSESEGMKILQAAACNGVTFFDTADVYGDGKSEHLIGKFLQTKHPKNLFIATKLGRSAQPGWPENFTLPTMRAHTEASLKRLGVEALDLTQLHCVPKDVLRRGEIFNNLRVLRSEGKIKRFGASVESMEEALICLEQEGLASLQIIFNIFRQKPITALFKAAQEKGVAIIVRLPLASGLLTGKMTTDTKFAKTDHRNFNRDGQSFNVGETFAGLPFDKGVELADELKALVPPGITMSQMALRWILDYDAVTTIIPGASKAAQIMSNVSASDLAPLPPELHDKLTKWYETRVAKNIRGPY